ncbi:MAG: ATP-binding protein, partial [Bacteroidota bacterium]|nr:ATP-binding protein [Bacteroidota bacterium]
FNKMSNEIQSNFKTLNENIAELEQFNWITSHDMKEPLRMISLYSEKVLILNEDKLDYNSIQDIKYIQKNVRRMINLINDVLEYVRSNDEDELKKTVLVDDIVKKLIEQNRELIENTNTKLEISNLKFEICCNEKILLQVFQNLLINSIKYRSDKDPILKIYASTDAKETIISFKDNGIGIDDEYQEKVFVMFQRLHDANDAEGTGIGLSICKKIINKMGGTIWVQPGLNVGTIIHIKIPTT